MKIFSAFFMFVISLTTGFAQAATTLYNGRTIEPVTLESALTTVPAGSVLIISERHDIVAHHDNQVAALQALAQIREHISVGLEFFETPTQPLVDQFTQGTLTEDDFLHAISWSAGNPFGFYRVQALFPSTHGGSTLALNAPRSLSGKVARTGLDSLTSEERALLPPDFALGCDAYHTRFVDVMSGGHVQRNEIERYFAAQSVWDDTMAFTATQFLTAHPEQVLVIIVGDFHAMYGGGLPDRLRARGASNVTVISQIDASAMSSTDLATELHPSPHWGARADYVWVTGL